MISGTEMYELAKKRFKKWMPASQAITYSQIELPYHSPPEFFKISFIGEGEETTSNGMLYERIQSIWKGKKDELFMSKKALNRLSVTNLSGNKKNEDNQTNNIGDFMAYFYLEGLFPELKWKIVGQDTSENKRIAYELFTQNSILRKDENYLWVIDANFNFIFAPEHQYDFALSRVRVKHGDLVSNPKALIGTVDNLTVGRLPASMYDCQSDF